jgi:hypothetical protein
MRVISDGAHEPDVVLHEQDRQAVGGEGPQDLGQPRDLVVVETRRGLVEQQRGRFGGQRAPEFDQAHRAGGQGAGGDLGERREAQAVEDRAGGGPDRDAAGIGEA